jgi:PDDEXK-like domain of unknown function (DUF3799)
MIANLEPGVHNLSAEVYHADPCVKPSLSSSIANVLLQQSPLHAWMAHPRMNPNFQRETDARADIGSVAHAIFLERDESKIVIVQANDWRTNAAKQARDDAHAQGKYAILEPKFVAVKKMVTHAEAYLNETELAGILESGAAERSVIWQEGETWCKARPDLLSADLRLCLDYKTTDSANPEVFIRQIPRMGYDTQASWYSRGLAALGHQTEFILLAQEITEPYSCSLISLSNAYKEVARLKVERALSMWQRCMRDNRWPAYPTSICYAEPTNYQLADMEAQSGEWQS